MPYGLDATGLTIKKQVDILADILASLKAPSPGVGVDVNTAARSLLYQVASIFATTESDLWSLLQAAYNSFSPDNAIGDQLENICALVGITKLAATSTAGVVQCTGTPGTVIPNYLNLTPGLVRRSTDNVFLNVLAEPTGGTWVIGALGTVDVNVEAVTAGAVVIDASQVDQIVNPVAGWTGVDNSVALTTGTDTETDSALRLRRERSLRIVGAGTDQAIRAAIEQLDYILAAGVVSNRDMVVDPVTGQAAKSFWVTIWPNGLTTAQKEEIGQTIWEKMPSGIEPWGSGTGTEVEVTVTDDQGYAQVVKFDYATEVACLVKITRTVNSEYPADGDDQLTDAVEAYFATLSVGSDVLVGGLLGLVGDIEGVANLQLQLTTSGPIGAWPADGVSLIMAANEVATVATVDITIA